MDTSIFRPSQPSSWQDHTHAFPQGHVGLSITLYPLWSFVRGSLMLPTTFSAPLESLLGDYRGTGWSTCKKGDTTCIFSTTLCVELDTIKNQETQKWSHSLLKRSHWCTSSNKKNEHDNIVRMTPTSTMSSMWLPLPCSYLWQFSIN